MGHLLGDERVRRQTSVFIVLGQARQEINETPGPASHLREAEVALKRHSNPGPKPLYSHSSSSLIVSPPCTLMRKHAACVTSVLEWVSGIHMCGT